MRLSLIAALALAAAPSLVSAQQDTTRRTVATPTPTLSLDEAVELARRNNPSYLQTANNRRPAAAGVRSAYGAFLPRLDAQFASTYRQGGQQFFAGTTTGAQSDIVSSSYDISAQMQLGVPTFTGPKLERATLRAVDADINSARENLRAQVAQQYVTVLQRQAQAALQDSLLLNVQAQLELAKARSAVGAGTTLDVKRAEVAVGQQEVASVRAHNDADVQMLNLFQLMGVAQPEGVVLTTAFEVAAPKFTLDEVLQLARDKNPQLRAARARETESTVNYRNSQAQYLPTLTLATGIGGYTSSYTDINGIIASARAGAPQQIGSCADELTIRQSAGLALPDSAVVLGIPAFCTRQFGFTDADAARMRSRNSAFPFSFTRSPVSFQAIVSLPIFNGFQREQRVQEAAALRGDAVQAVRSTELALTAGVSGAYLSLVTAKRASDIQTQNTETARQALQLAEERYRVGANTFVDVQQARADYERAQTDRISAIYEYHRAFAALESAVGRPLR